MLLLLFAISGATIIEAIVWIIIGALIFYLANWLMGYIGIDEPFAKVLRVIIAVAVFLFLVNGLLMLVGKPLFTW